VERIAPPVELPTLVLFDGWATLFRERVVPWRIALAERARAQLESEVLPPYVAARRWYATKGERLARVSIADHAQWSRAGQSWLLVLAHAERAGGAEPQTYFLPLALGWEEADEARTRKLAPATIAKVRQQAQVGVLADALGDEAFVREVAAAIGAGEEVKTARGRIRFRDPRAQVMDNFPNGVSVCQRVMRCGLSRHPVEHLFHRWTMPCRAVECAM
jgi:maltose alpha-D-glucosyltransferase/alpha-amylase